MPLEVKDCDEGRGNVISGWEFISDQEYIDVITRHLTQDEEKFAKYRYSLLDFTAATRTDVSSESIVQVAELCSKASKVNPDPVIAVASGTDLIYGLSRMYEALVSHTDWETMVFRSRKDASEWLKQRVSEKFGIDNITFY